MVKNKTIIISMMMIFALGMFGCSQQNTNQPTASPPSSPSAQNPGVNSKIVSKLVTINHFVFEPGEITVNTGETVTWKHDDNVAHTIVSTGLFESSVMNRNNEFTYTFDKPGEYTYYCGIHPSMAGKIIVK